MAQQQSTERPVYTYTPGDGHRYTWHGGEYIEVYRVADILADPDAPAVDVINVWDYGAGKPRIPRTLTGFLGAVDAYQLH